MTSSTRLKDCQRISTSSRWNPTLKKTSTSRRWKQTTASHRKKGQTMRKQSTSLLTICSMQGYKFSTAKNWSKMKTTTRQPTTNSSACLKPTRSPSACLQQKKTRSTSSTVSPTQHLLKTLLKKTYQLRLLLRRTIVRLKQKQLSLTSRSL